MPAAPADLEAPLQIDSSLAHLLHRAQQIAADFYSLPPEADLTLRQYVVMSVLAEREGVTQVEVVRLSGVDRSTLAEMLQRLERQGLVERVRSAEDFRANLVKLTPRGRSAQAEAAARCAEVDRRLLERLPAREGARLLRSLQRLVSPPAARRRGG